MDDLLIPGGVITTIVALVLGWVLSGQIRKTDADKLWEEAGDIRRWLRKELAAAHKEREDLLKRVERLETDNEAKTERIDKLEADNDALRHQVEKLEHENVRLTGENDRLTLRVAELEGPAKIT